MFHLVGSRNAVILFENGRSGGRRSLFDFIRRNFRQRKNLGKVETNKTTLQPQPQQQQQPFHPKPSDISSIRWSVLIKPFLFTLGFGGTTFVVASIWQYENMRKFSHQRRREWMERNRYVYGEFRSEMNRLWNSLTEGQRIFVPILFLNLIVFAAWRIPSLQNTVMLRYFCSDPGSKSSLCLPMLLSTFSHYSFLHLAANMYVLHSFCGAVVQVLGKEQFLALYLSSGVFASFCSLVHKVVLKRPGSSLGASGAICAVLGLFGCLVPDARMQIIFFPFFTFTANAAIKGLIALDTAGIFLRWKVFDHAAHLGGTLLGIWWAYYGNELIWRRREKIMTFWHENIRRKK